MIEMLMENHDVLVVGESASLSDLLKTAFESTPCVFAFKLTAGGGVVGGIAKAQAACRAGRPFAVAYVDAEDCDAIGCVERLWEIDAQMQIVLCTDDPQKYWKGIVARLGRSDCLMTLRKPFGAEDVLQTALVLAAKWNLAARLAVHTQETSSDDSQADKARRVSNTVAELLAMNEVVVEIAPASADAPPLDVADLMARCMGNAEFLERLLGKFRSRLGDEVNSLASAITSKNGSETARLAHSLKGSAANVSAAQLARMAKDLELAGLAGQFDSAMQCLDEIRAEVDRCMKYEPAVAVRREEKCKR